MARDMSRGAAAGGLASVSGIFFGHADDTSVKSDPGTPLRSSGLVLCSYYTLGSYTHTCLWYIRGHAIEWMVDVTSPESPSKTFCAHPHKFLKRLATTGDTEQLRQALTIIFSRVLNRTVQVDLKRFKGVYCPSTMGAGTPEFESWKATIPQSVLADGTPMNAAAYVGWLEKCPQSVLADGTPTDHATAYEGWKEKCPQSLLADGTPMNATAYKGWKER